MRKLMLFTIGFSIACGIGIYFAYGMWLLLLLALFLAALLAVICIPSAFSKQVQCVLIGTLIGFVWLWGFDCLYLSPTREGDEQRLILSIEVTDYSHQTENGVAADGKIWLDKKPYAIRFYLNEDVQLKPGDRVEGGFILRYTGVGAEDPTYHQGKGIFLLCYPKGTFEIVPCEVENSRYFAADLRQKILSVIDSLFPADTAGFAKALLLGETDGLTFQNTWSLKTAGIYHIVAVSGMHVSILFALIYFLCIRKRFLTAVLGIPALFLFAAVAGFSPSIVRACIMQSLMIVAMLADKEYDPPTALSAAVLVLLTVNPLSITSVSFQLSVGCMAGILLFSNRIYGYWSERLWIKVAKGKTVKARVVRFVLTSVCVTLGAISLTTPLSAYYFGTVSIAGVVSNLLLLWIVSLIFYGVVAACILGALWMPLGIGIGWVISWLIRFVLGVSNMISRVPLSSVYSGSVYIVAWLIFAYIMLLVFSKGKKKHPIVLTFCILAGLAGALACSWIEPRLDTYRITAVDVGQGQSIVLQQDGKYYVVDCGGDTGEEAANRTIQLLFSQGVFRLDGVILTHYDADHAGGVEKLMSVVPTDVLYLPVLDKDNEYKDILTEKFAEKVHWVREEVVLDDAEITIIPSDDTQDSNESSLCILFQPENCDILITGDRSEVGELALMEDVELPDLELLIAGHHGSRTSTSWELLNVTRPEIVIISVGKDNSYGHPTWETLERLDLFGCAVYRTDLEGTIIFRG